MTCVVSFRGPVQNVAIDGEHALINSVNGKERISQ